MAKRTREQMIVDLMRAQERDVLRKSARARLDDVKTLLHARSFDSALEAIDGLRGDVEKLALDGGAS